MAGNELDQLADNAFGQTFNRLRSSLAQLRAGQLLVEQFAQSWRAQTELLAVLPPAYAVVMENVLQRLESASLFSEESCSFSQQDLLENLDVWLRKASQIKIGQ